MIKNTEPKITMKDIAQKLGVSVVTVSKAFNNKERRQRRASCPDKEDR